MATYKCTGNYSKTSDEVFNTALQLTHDEVQEATKLISTFPKFSIYVIDILHETKL